MSRGDERDPRQARPLREEEPGAAAVLDAANHAFSATSTEEARAWAALEARRRKAAGRRWLAALIGIGAVSAAAAIALVVSGRRPAPPAGAPPTATARGEAQVPARREADEAPAPEPEPAPEPAPVVARPAPLHPGRSLVAAGVRAHLSAQGVARVISSASAPGASLLLERGTLEIDAAERKDADEVEVRVGAYHMQGGAARFSVSAQAGGGVDVVVREGRVTVWSSTRLVARVVAGQRWTNLRAAAPDRAGAGAGAAAESPPAPAETAARDCSRLVHEGATDEALACFEEQARLPGQRGENALLEVARIRRDVKRDLAGAERALAEHDRRFPHGALAPEASLSRTELLLRLDRADDALAETERLPADERLYWRAVSLAKLGRREEAARAFDEYLARPDGTRRAEAQRRKRELAP
jgi:hypothetical protein